MVDLESTNHNLLRLQEKLAEYEKMLAEYKSALEEAKQGVKDPEFLENVAFTEIYPDIEEQARKTIRTKAIKALEASGEFDYPPYRDGLLEVIDDPELIGISQVKGIPRIKVEYFFDAIAGPLESWAKAVNTYRETIREERVSIRKGKPFDPPADVSSKKWKEHIYAVDREEGKATRRKWNRAEKRYITVDVTDMYKGLYEKTVKARLALSGEIAPWWSLLEHGNAPGSLSSDRDGGIPYPIVPAQKFISDSSTEVALLGDTQLNEKMVELKKAYEENIKSIPVAITYIETSITELTDKIAAETPVFDEAEKRVDEAFEGFEENEKTLKRIKELTAKIAAGEPVPERIQIGGVRRRTKDLVREFNEEMAKLGDK
jgi:hypothetical protein